ncbi:MAG: transglutaminase-like domain-containing protein [Fuerstiella sp.]
MRVVFLCSAIVAFAAEATNAAEPVSRETWYAYTNGDVRYASQHVTVSRRKDGNFEYQTDARALVNVLGAQKQEVRSSMNAVVSPDYSVLSIHLERREMSGLLTVNGVSKDGVLELDFSRGNLKWKDQVQLGESTILATCLNDFLGDQTPGSVRTVRLLDAENWNIRAAKISPHATSTRVKRVWAIQYEDTPAHGTVEFDADGICATSRFRFPDVTMVCCTPDEARELTYRVLKGRDVLMFPVDKDIGHPDKLTDLQVKLSWSEVSRDQLILTDRRQRVADSQQNGDQHEVTVQLQKTHNISPSNSLKNRPPDFAEEFAGQLAETRYIKPNDISIREQAARWIDGSESSLEAVQKLCDGVSGLLKGGTLIAETLAGPEVLQAKHGKCTEYSTLFASLARSAGIPTRIVLGERLSGAQWVGHMWNEAFVGEWVTVDSTANEVGDSFSLIKLVHSDTVDGTQSARHALAGSLNIEVVDFKQSASNTTSKWTTGIAGNVYTNANFGFQISSPDPAWKIVDKTQGGPVPTIRFELPNEYVHVHLIAFPIPGNIGPTVVLGARRTQFAIADGFKLIEDKVFEVGNVRGHLHAFQRRKKNGKRGLIKTREYVWINGTTGYLLNIIGPSMAFGEYEGKLESLLKRFSHIEDPSSE